MARARSRSQAGRALIVVGSLLVSAAVVVPWAYTARGWWGTLSAAVAGATCLFAGLLALWLVRMFRGPEGVLPQVVLGMFARMGMPLLMCIVVYVQGGRLADAGFVYYLLVFYFVTLVVETFLLVGDLQPQVPGKSTV